MAEEKKTSVDSKQRSVRRRSAAVKQRFQGKAFLVPSFITVIASFCGFLAIIKAFGGQYEYACKCIGLAFLLDGLDGRVARKLNATSEFGKEFDSLSDAVAFGVAPAILLYFWGFQSFADEFGILVSFIFVVCGTTRLARFNIRASAEKSSSSFDGLPIPAAAGAVVAMIYWQPAQVESYSLTVCVIIYTLFLAGLMVTMIPYASIKNVKLAQVPQRLLLFLVSVVVALAWYHGKVVLMLVITSYVLSGPLLLLRRKLSPSK